MRLGDVVASLELTAYPIIGLIAFVAVFGVVSWRAFRTSRSDLNRCANLPLDTSECDCLCSPTQPASDGGAS